MLLCALLCVCYVLLELVIWLTCWNDLVLLELVVVGLFLVIVSGGGVS